MKTQNTYPFPTYRPLSTSPAVLAKTVVNTRQKEAQEWARIGAVALKLTDENRAFLLNKAHILGIGIVHVFDEDNPKGGMTIAFRKVSPFAKGTMVDVAVATCSKEDSFNRKTGTKLALESFFNGDTIQLPLNNPASKEGISTQVKWAFEGLFYAI